jgi:hypothetical protein
MYIRCETRENTRLSFTFSPVSKHHTHITYMLRQCISIVYVCSICDHTDTLYSWIGVILNHMIEVIFSEIFFVYMFYVVFSHIIYLWSQRKKILAFLFKCNFFKMEWKSWTLNLLDYFCGCQEYNVSVWSQIEHTYTILMHCRSI